MGVHVAAFFAHGLLSLRRVQPRLFVRRAREASRTSYNQHQHFARLAPSTRCPFRPPSPPPSSLRHAQRSPLRPVAVPYATILHPGRLAAAPFEEAAGRGSSVLVHAGAPRRACVSDQISKLTKVTCHFCQFDVQLVARWFSFQKSLVKSH